MERESFARCKGALNYLSYVHTFLPQLKGPNVKLCDIFGIRSGIGGVAAHSHRSNIARFATKIVSYSHRRLSCLL